MTTEWAETKAILSEVEQLFNRDDDIRYIFDVKKMAKEIDSHCSSYLLETKEIIKSKRRECERNAFVVPLCCPILERAAAAAVVVLTAGARRCVQPLARAFSHRPPLPSFDLTSVTSYASLV